MIDTGRRVIFLTGAPLPSSLRWDKVDLSGEHHQCPFGTASDNLLLSWRSLPLEVPHLPTGLTQASRENVFPKSAAAENSILSTDACSSSFQTDFDQSQDFILSSSERMEILSQYYEHSFAVHEDIPSSQIIGTASFSDDSFTTDYGNSFIESSMATNFGPEALLARSRLASGLLSNIIDMPDAAYLRSITPQTMTVNLVMGIISIAQPRVVKTRRDGKCVELVEMLVGDETRAGFGINFWLPSQQEQKHSGPRDNNFRLQIEQLRPRDIILAKNVALNSFRAKVYGQSLRRGITTLDLIYRDTVDEDDHQGAYIARDLEDQGIGDPGILKVAKVKDWVTHFVGANLRPLAMGKKSKSYSKKCRDLEALPCDTQ